MLCLVEFFCSEMCQRAAIFSLPHEKAAEEEKKKSSMMKIFIDIINCGRFGGVWNKMENFPLSTATQTHTHCVSFSAFDSHPHTHSHDQPESFAIYFLYLLILLLRY